MATNTLQNPDEESEVYTVTLTIPDLDAYSPGEAARMFVAALATADWSGGLHLSVKSSATGDDQPVTLTADEVGAALNGRPYP